VNTTTLFGLWLKMILSDVRSFMTGIYPNPQKGLSVRIFLHYMYLALTRPFIYAGYGGITTV